MCQYFIPSYCQIFDYVDIHYSFISLCIFGEIEFSVEHILILSKIGFLLVRKHQLAVDG